jgi:hypothetical protein
MCRKTERTGDHNVEQEKPSLETQIPRGFAQMCNRKKAEQSPPQTIMA